MCRVHVEDPNGLRLLSLSLRSLVQRRAGADDSVTVVCVGTDRSTGDAFGPLVGTKLRQLAPPGVHIMGTLAEPVHATNLHEALRSLAARPQKGLVIAVDACLGRAENVGCISVRDYPLQPGSGVRKQLPEVGDIHLVGIVNVGGFMEYFVLQSTRLDLVMRMADLTAGALYRALLGRPRRQGGPELPLALPRPPSAKG